MVSPGAWAQINPMCYNLPSFVIARSFQLAFYDDFIKGQAAFGPDFDIYSYIKDNETLTAIEKRDNSTCYTKRTFLGLKIVFDD